MEREEAFLEGSSKREDTGRLIHIVSHQLKRTIFLSSHQDSGLTSMQNRILNFILLHTLEKPLYQKDIEKEFNIRKSTATEILKLMEKKGYIRRESVPYDARLKKLVLTDTGRELHEKTKDMIDILEEQTIEGIAKEDLDTFYRVIDQLKSNVKNMLGETSC